MSNSSTEEALRYKKDDLLGHIDKRRDNIKVFEKAIENEKIEIDRELKMIEIIEIHKKS